MIFQCIFQELRETLIKKINEIGTQENKEKEKKLKELLVKSFPVIKIKPLRPVVRFMKFSPSF